jgi:NitT/TauT family transport system substrate-binding protein
MKRLLYFLTAVMVMASCGQSYEEKRQMIKQQRIQQQREDSAALKIAVMPTLDCLPLFVAKETDLFDKDVSDIRLKMFTAQMDCDTALAGGSVEGAVSDLVRTERLIQKGTPLTYLTSTNAYWQLYSNRTARIKTLKQLDDKMVAMTRYSVTDMLADMAMDSAKLARDRVFKIQVNDVYIRLKMLLNGEIDAVLLTEPQASQARLARHTLIQDSRKLGLKQGVIAFRDKAMKNKARMRQIVVFRKGYNMACDSLNCYGVKRYRDVLVKYCKLKPNQVDSLPDNLKFQRVTPPTEEELERARKWLKQS